VPAAYALARLPAPGAGRILPGMLALAFFPGVILLVTLSRTLTALGLYDRLPGIGIAQLGFTLPLAVWFLTYAFGQVPDDLTDAARLDGAGTRQVILRIVLPIARPGIAATVAVVFLASWSDFLFSTGLSQTPRSETLLVLLSKLPVLGFLGGQMAAGVLMSVPVAAVVGALLIWLDRRGAPARHR
jgi:ABC-type glycerol-3-phosphate transport system permease component